jgi:predicted TIM-barrel fold metal-dependent hydrolase
LSGLMWLDVHVHPLLIKELTDSRPALLRDADRVFDLRTSPQPLSTLLREMDVCGIERAVLLPINCKKSHGCETPSNQDVADIAGRNSGRLVGFASVDPNAGDDALRELQRSHDQLGLKGLKLNPALQDFDPTGSQALEIFKEAERFEMPILIHTGITFSNRFSMRYNHPLPLDEIARRHPKLRICLAHFGWPWVWDAVTVAIRNPNVYIDTAGTFAGTPQESIRQITSLVPIRVIENALSEKLMFGSDYPRIEINKMFAAVSALPLRKDVLEAVLGGNALAFLGET